MRICLPYPRKSLNSLSTVDEERSPSGLLHRTDRYIAVTHAGAVPGRHTDVAADDWSSAHRISLPSMMDIMGAAGCIASIRVSEQ